MKKLIAMLLVAALVCCSAMAVEIGTRMKVVNCNEWITLREDPSKKADSLEQMPLGADNLILLDGDFGDFACVSYNGEIGYALWDYLEVAESFEGEEMSLNNDQRYNVNLFLSNFSEQYFAVREGAYDMNSADETVVADFAINHIWFNKQNQLEWGEWGEYNVRLPANKINATAEKYLNKSVPKEASSSFDYKNNYYYWTETGGHANDGFVCYDRVEELDENRISVYFRVYGAGESWSNKACYLKPEEAGGQYWCTQKGHAVINLDGGSLYDRSSWYLERYATVWDE